MKAKNSFSNVAPRRNENHNHLVQTTRKIENVVFQAAPVSILLAEADVNWGRLLQDYLNKQGFSVGLFMDGQEAWRQFSSEQYNFCIVNPVLPTINGLDLAQMVRRKTEHTPIMFMSALQDDTKSIRAHCFEAGGDDFILQSQCLQDLAFRIRAIQKRFCFYSLEKRRRVFDLGVWRFDYDNQWLFHKQKYIRLTYKESVLLYVLCLNRGKVLTHEQALAAVWNSTLRHNLDSLTVYISRLRNLLSDTHSVIINEHGEGFKLVTYRRIDLKRQDDKVPRSGKSPK